MKKNYEKPEFNITILISESVLDLSINNGNATLEDKENEIL